MSLRVAHVTSSSSFGGISRFVLEIGSLLQRTKDTKQIVIAFPEGGTVGPFLDKIEKAGLTARCLQKDMPRLIAATFELIFLLKQHQIQIMCAHGYKARMLGWFAAKWLGIPIIGVSHSASGWSDGLRHRDKLYERLDRWMYRRMDHVACVSQAAADDVIRDGTPADRVSVIYNAICLDRFDGVPDFSYRHQLESMFPHKPKLIVGAAARLLPAKGFDILITAAVQILKLGLDVGFVIFGEGPLREALQKQIDNAGISSFVVMPGRTDQLDQYMPYFDLFALSSHVEGLPTVLLEAMAARTAIVATRVAGSTELMVEGSTGLMVPPNNPDALAEAMQKVLNDNELRRTMGENGRKRVEQHFTFEPQAEKYWELFCRLVCK